MEHIVLLLKDHGITEIVVTLHYLADEIEGYFGDGSEWGVSMVYSVEDTPLGTAGSVKQDNTSGPRFSCRGVSSSKRSTRRESPSRLRDL